jgi:hypothetical protein
MLFGDPNPHVIEKHWQLHLKGWVWFGSGYKLCNRNLIPKQFYLHKINTGPSTQGKEQIQFCFW